MHGVFFLCLGYCSSLPVFSVHNGNKLMNYAMMLAGYGNMADSIEYAESHRHLGKIRLTIARENFSNNSLILTIKFINRNKHNLNL